MYDNTELQEYVIILNHVFPTMIYMKCVHLHFMRFRHTNVACGLELVGLVQRMAAASVGEVCRKCNLKKIIVRIADREG